ncbi:hypothetical protein FA15DRAFT_659671 [Coprinopsis marcescibilis]|uniref:Uncharacterized protein n=1 Tax=Coprinopsis marcescibilis TaxID=230819 RepID=A0A5C3KHX6_COPMA|nr:hypothetical protein FA15DRAFT_659671 [Coprinopsis marcescibilis]
MAPRKNTTKKAATPIPIPNVDPTNGPPASEPHPLPAARKKPTAARGSKAKANALVNEGSIETATPAPAKPTRANTRRADPVVNDTEQPLNTTVGVPATTAALPKPPRRPRRTAEEVEAEKAERKKAKDAKEMERAKVKEAKQREKQAKEQEKHAKEQQKAEMEHRWEEYNRTDNEAVKALEAAGVHRIQDTGLTVDQLSATEYEYIDTSGVSPSTSDGELSEISEQEELEGKAAERQASLYRSHQGKDCTVEDDIWVVSHCARSPRYQLSPPLASGPNVRVNRGNIAAVPSHPGTIQIHDIGGLTDEDAAGEPPNFDDPSNNAAQELGYSRTPAGSRGGRMGPFTATTTPIFKPRQPVFTTVQNQVFTTPANTSLPYQHGQAHPPTQAYHTGHVYHQPAHMFLPQAPQPSSQMYQQQPAAMAMNRQPVRSHAMQAMQMATNYQQHGHQRAIGASIGVTTQHTPSIHRSSQKKRAPPLHLTANTVRMEHLPAFALANNRWKGKFLPTLYHALYTSREPFKGFVVSTPRFNEMVQNVINMVYPEAQYTAKLIGDPIHLLAHSRIIERRGGIAQDAVKLLADHIATFRSLSEAHNWLTWAQTVYGPLFFREPLPAYLTNNAMKPGGRLQSPFIIALAQRALGSSENAFRSDGLEPPCGLLAIIMTALDRAARILDRAARILDANGQIQTGLDGKQLKIFKFSDENWGTKLDLYLSSLNAIMDFQWFELLEELTPVPINEAPVQVFGGNDIMLNAELGNLFAFASPKKGQL